jgi:hypothetical protein
MTEQHRWMITYHECRDRELKGLKDFQSLFFPIVGAVRQALTAPPEKSRPVPRPLATAPARHRCRPPSVPPRLPAAIHQTLAMPMSEAAAELMRRHFIGRRLNYDCHEVVAMFDLASTDELAELLHWSYVVRVCSDCEPFRGHTSSRIYRGSVHRAVSAVGRAFPNFLLPEFLGMIPRFYR